MTDRKKEFLERESRDLKNLMPNLNEHQLAYILSMMALAWDSGRFEKEFEIELKSST